MKKSKETVLREVQELDYFVSECRAWKGSGWTVWIPTQVRGRLGDCLSSKDFVWWKYNNYWQLWYQTNSQHTWLNLVTHWWTWLIWSWLISVSILPPACLVSSSLTAHPLCYFCFLSPVASLWKQYTLSSSVWCNYSSLSCMAPF